MADHFLTIDNLWINAINACKYKGKSLESRDGDCLEIIGKSFQLIDIDYSFLLHPLRKLSPIYASAELLWYLSGTSNIQMIKAYAPQYERFAEKGLAYGAYGHRMTKDESWTDETSLHKSALMQKIGGFNTLSQISAITRLLSINPNTRQAIIALWNPADLVHSILGDHKDLPCTICLQFILRKGLLNMVVFMRSNDVWLGLPYDVYCFTAIQRLIAYSLNVGTGTYTHHVGSLHLYTRDISKVPKGELSTGGAPLRHLWDPIKDDMRQAVHNAIDTEERVRNGEITCGRDIFTRVGIGNILSDSVYLCASKWITEDLNSYITSLSLQEAYNDRH